MKNSFLYSDTNKRYHTLDYANRRRYGGRVVKIPLNAGFTCPNIDGLRGRGGCTYCSSQGSGEHAGDRGTAADGAVSAGHRGYPEQMARGPVYSLFSGAHQHLRSGGGAPPLF